MKKEDLEQKLQIQLSRVTHIKSCLEIWKGLHAEFSSEAENNAVFQESPYFWNMVLKTFQENFLLGVAKLYDENSDSLGLRKTINICEQNQSLFPTEHQRKLYDHFGKKEIVNVVPVDIVATIKSANDCYNSVQEFRSKLITIRDKYLAHSDKKYAENPALLYEEFSLKWEDFEKLIFVAQKILNGFLTALIDMCVSTTHWDRDDFKHLLFAANAGIKTLE